MFFDPISSLGMKAAIFLCLIAVVAGGLFYVTSLKDARDAAEARVALIEQAHKATLASLQAVGRAHARDDALVAKLDELDRARTLNERVAVKAIKEAAPSSCPVSDKINAAIDGVIE